MRKKIGFTAVVAAVLVAMMASSVTPAAAWCRWGRCGGWGWRGGPGIGAVAAGVVAGAVVAGAAVAATRPYGPGPGPYYGGPGGGYYACPAGYHWGPGGRACFAN